MTYNVKISQDNGRNWAFANSSIADPWASGNAAREGAFDMAHAVAAGSFDWNVSDAAQYPQGSYLFRVEGYREGLPLHYSFHQVRVQIKRN